MTETKTRGGFKNHAYHKGTYTNPVDLVHRAYPLTHLVIDGGGVDNRHQHPADDVCRVDDLGSEVVPHLGNSELAYFKIFRWKSNKYEVHLTNRDAAARLPVSPFSILSFLVAPRALDKRTFRRGRLSSAAAALPQFSKYERTTTTVHAICVVLRDWSRAPQMRYVLRSRRTQPPSSARPLPVSKVCYLCKSPPPGVELRTGDTTMRTRQVEPEGAPPCLLLTF